MLDSQKIHFRCPHCDKAISVPSRLAGKRGKCPGCGTAITAAISTERTSIKPTSVDEISVAQVAIDEVDAPIIPQKRRGLFGGKEKSNEVQDLLSPFASRASQAADAMSQAAAVAARARTPKEALKAMGEIVKILESGGPDCAEPARNMRVLLAVDDESVALEHCQGLAKTLASTAKQMKEIGGLLNSF